MEFGPELDPGFVLPPSAPAVTAEAPAHSQGNGATVAPGTEGRQDIVAEAQDVVEPQRHVLLVGDAHLVHERLRARRCGLSRLRAGTAAGSAARVLASAGVTPAGAGPAPWVPRAAEDAASGGGGAATGQQPAGTLSKPAGNGETASLAAFLLHLTRGGGSEEGLRAQHQWAAPQRGVEAGGSAFLLKQQASPRRLLSTKQKQDTQTDTTQTDRAQTGGQPWRGHPARLPAQSPPQTQAPLPDPSLLPSQGLPQSPHCPPHRPAHKGGPMSQDSRSLAGAPLPT